MIVPSGAVDKAMGIHLQKIYMTNATDSTDQIRCKDIATISKFAALVERGRQCALSLPEVREDLVQQARAAVEAGNLPSADALASAVINAAVEGQV